jgi:hypothetical protein
MSSSDSIFFNPFIFSIFFRFVPTAVPGPTLGEAHFQTGGFTTFSRRR